MAWEDVLRIVNAPLPRDRQWTQARQVRATRAYVRDHFLPAAVLGRADRRASDDRRAGGEHAEAGSGSQARPLVARQGS